MFESDFIVEFNDEELGECRTYPKNFKGYEQAIKDLKLYKAKQNQRIVELEEQLKNAIVPKFKVGQTSYYIFNGVVGIFKPEKVCEVRDLLILGIQFYGQELQYQTTYGLFNENTLFATKEEAQAKLEELKGE